MYPLPVLVTTGKMQLERGHRPLNLLRLITHTETEGWEGWGQRAPHTQTCASPKPLRHLSTPMFLPRPTPSSTTHPNHWSAALLLIFCCSPPPRELKKFIIRNSDDSASWCTTLSCSVAAPQLWLSCPSLFNLCSHSLLSSILRIHFLCRCRKKWRTCRSDLTKYSDL